MPWLVLNTDGFLLSECVLGYSQFRLKDKGGLYNGSVLQETMNDFYNGKTKLFTDKERGAIKETLLKGASMFDRQPDLNAYLFPLSEREAYKLGLGSDILIAKSITRQSSRGGSWWLRTSLTGGNAYTIEGSGYLDFYEFYYNYNYDGVRPAFNLDLNPVLFISAATGGKPSGAEGTEALVPNSISGVSAWKLTLQDSSRSGFGITSVGFDPGRAVVGYTNAKTGNNEFISAVIVDDSDNVLYYGRIKNLSKADDANGRAFISIPSGVTLGGDVKLKVFNEQYNGDKKTGYASELIKVPFYAYNDANVVSTIQAAANNGTSVVSTQAAANNPVPELPRLLKYRITGKMHGEDVRLAQQQLVKNGYNLGNWGVDGVYGKYTRGAVTEFQKDIKLEADGIVGQNTWAKLFE